MKNVGFIGWRGMVGSVLMQRMVEERDFDAIRPVFFSTSQLGQAAPTFGGTATGTLQDAFDLDALKALDIIVTCQGGDYTNEIYPKLRESGWQGYWIDAASSLRMKDDAIIILDPVNQDVITDGLNIYVNHTGNPGLATGGSGDVLAGMIVSLLGQHIMPLEAAAAAAWLHGAAADLAAEKLGEYGMVPEDLLLRIPRLLP